MKMADDHLARVQRRIVDMAVHEAVERLGKEFAPLEGLLSRACQVAAMNALQQFSTHIDSQIRLIEVDREARTDEIQRKMRIEFLQEYQIGAFDVKNKS